MDLAHAPIFWRMKTETENIYIASRGRNTAPDGSIQQHLEVAPIPGKTNTITTVQKDNLIMQLNPSRESNGAQPYQQNRVYHPDGIAPALMQGQGGRTVNVITDGGGGLPRIRRLTPTECARLQTVPEWYRWVVSETQQYKMLGNGWTVEVIKHIFSFLPDRFKK